MNNWRNIMPIINETLEIMKRKQPCDGACFGTSDSSRIRPSTTPVIYPQETDEDNKNTEGSTRIITLENVISPEDIKLL